MPPSSSRRTRTRRAAELQDTSDMEAPDSSPSRPARKRRKVSPQADQQRDLSPQQDGPRNSALSKRGLPDTEMEGNEQEMINAVIASLKQSSQRPQVAYDHSNEIHEHTNRDGVQAYAKVAGRDWTYYVKKLEVNIGRSSEDTAARASVERLKESSPVSHKGGDSLLVDIDLGPSKLVSRLHALIYFDSAGTGKWQIRINGRNSVRVNETIVHRGEKISLGSGDVLDIDGTQMMFVTPENDIRIHPVFLQRAGYSLSGGPGATAQDFPQAQPEPVSEIDRPDGFTRNSTAPTAPPVAEPKRPSTPETSRTIDIEPKSKQSPAYNRGMMLESTERIDYSLDSAKDLKPPYSYATMIGQAILSSEEEKMTLNNIYNWIMDNYAFYRHSQAQWQNSIRHNLSLNKSFQKIPRRTDEPGKGMKWQIVPEHRDEFTKRGPRTSKGGARGSSAPSSPAAKEPSTKLPSVNVRNAGSTGPEDHMEPSNFRQRLQASPKSVTPPLSPYRPTSKGTYTPERSSHLREEENGLPDPVRRGSHAEPRRSINSFALSDQAQDSPPTLSSSAYLDESMPMITPAPRRQMPRLAPPSTAQVPSTYMPTSSPAPFWKYVDFGSTPAKPMAELSPSKSLGLVVPQSSSPPPANDSKDPPSPTKASGVDMPAPEIRTEAQPEVIAPIEPPEETDDSAGFDLARGFQPIGQFHKRMSNGVGGP